MNLEERINKIVIICFCLIILTSCVKVTKHNYRFYKPTDENPTVNSIMQKVNQLIDDMSNENWDNVYSNFSSISKQNISKDVFSNQADYLKNQFGVIVDTDILEIHWANVTSGNLKGKPNGYSMLSGKSEYLSNPVQLLFVNPGDNAIVLCETKIQDSNLICWLTLTLTKNEEDWELNGFNLNTNIAKGHSGEWFIEKANELEGKNQLKSAYLYKYLGAQISSPFYPVIVPINSSNLLISLSQRIPKDFPSQNLRKTVKWNVNEKTFIISNISFISGPELLALDVTYYTELKNIDSVEAQQERKEIFEYIIQDFPEYKENFDGVYVGSSLKSGQGFRDYFEF